MNEPAAEPVLFDTEAEPAGTKLDRQSLLLHAEDVVVSKRVRQTLVRAATTTSLRDEAIEVDLNQDHLVVERVAVGRVVEAIPPVRQEGDVTILPVVEEEVVITRRLILKEEVHMRRVRTVTRHTETVVLRKQTISVTRTDLGD